ncbi:TetR/AcrR family transcriptional regulator [Roseivirga echinicomitans]
MAITKVDRNEWLKAGAQKFATKGLDGINVERLAKQLKCNKSSFYWHFQTKENFLHELIHYWFEHSTSPMVHELKKETDSKKRFRRFIQLSFEDKSRKDFMFHLRKIGERDHNVKQLLQQLNDERLSFMTLLIQDLGYTQEIAHKKAQILMLFYLGWYELNKSTLANTENEIADALLLINDFITF